MAAHGERLQQRRQRSTDRQTQRGTAQDGKSLRSPKAAIPPNRAVIFWVVLVVVGILAGLLLAFAQSVSEPDFALPVRGDPVQPEHVREIVATMLDTYSGLTQLISASFGAVAFLVAFQQQNRVPIVMRTWALLALGLAFLGGALMLSLVGSEALLVMIERNAVDLGAPALRYGRWATYALLLAAAAFLGLFALDVSASPSRAPAERSSG